MTVDVVAHDIFFEPKELTIPANTDVTVNLPNEGAAATQLLDRCARHRR